jgi:hypothetical protein
MTRLASAPGLYRRSLGGAGERSEQYEEWDADWWEEEEEEGGEMMSDARAALSFLPDLMADLFVSEQRLARAAKMTVAAAQQATSSSAQAAARSSRWQDAIERTTEANQRAKDLKMLEQFRRMRGVHLDGGEPRLIK